MDTTEIKDLVQEILNDTRTALLQIVKDSSPQVADATGAYITNAKARVSQLMTFMLEGGDFKFLAARLKDEEKILENELLSFAVISKAAAQDAISAIQGILIQAVFAVLPSGKLNP